MSQRKDVDPLEDTRAESIGPSTLIAGTPVGGYHLQHVLGEGGMGVVWSAQDPLLDRRVAIKVLKRTDAAPQLRLRLLREARAMARLKHPNVLTVYEVGTEGERDFIAMELVEGSPLDVWLAADPSHADVLAALFAAGRGLAAAHAAGLVHRDFKPNNVLRSVDGRVLVTDFGLARGLVDDPLAEAVAEAAEVHASPPAFAGRRADSVLDSPLTRTGAMIGTPAYMAPEQYIGTAPDPRTDQFSFCVTAWQALTGLRPYHGATLEELRRSVTRGVLDDTPNLARPVRAVLARGLDPDPAKRWPDLDSLLGALAHAARKRTRVWPWVAGGAVIVAIATVALTRGGDPAAVATCTPADTAYAKLPGEPAAITDHRARWIAEYDRACKVPRSRASLATIECLLAVRDRAAIAATLADPYDWLPAPGACSGRTPVVPPALPEARSGIAVALAAGLALPASDDLAKAAARLATEADLLGWKPLGPMIDLLAGRAYLQRGDSGRARELLARAAAAAEGTDARTAAFARIALVEASMIELDHPGDYPTTKPGTLHEELARLLTYARSAVKHAGDDPVLAGMLALREARIQADLAERTPKRDYGEAFARTTEARRHFESIGDLRRLAEVAMLEATLALERGDARALDDAAFATRGAAEALTRATVAPPPGFAELCARIAFARGDFEKAHDQLARHIPMAPAKTSPRTGVVLDASGKPALGATVVVWQGELHGDPDAVVTDPGTLTGEVRTTAADGTFTLAAPAGSAIIAQRGDLRSSPRSLGDGPITLQLAATAEITGRVEADSAIGLEGFARFSLGANAWFVRVPVEKNLAFRIRRVPRGTVQTGVIATAGPASRRLTAAKPALAATSLFDVVARGSLDDSAAVWLFRERAHPATRTEAEALALAATDVLVAPLQRIGSRTSDAGRGLYAAGDRHAIVPISGAYATVCIAAGPRVTCKPLDATRPAAILVELAP
ncbi:MAG: serine/threonine-protein kinase [Kofleriaceae bacterium]